MNCILPFRASQICPPRRFYNVSISKYFHAGGNMFKQFKHLTWKASLMAAAASTLVFSIALAASGDLDMTFDGDGLVTTDVNASNPGQFDLSYGIAIQPADGKIVAAGFSTVPAITSYDFAVARYETNGSLDTTFSGDGRLVTSFGADEYALDVAVQPNGKIVVAGKKCVNNICDVALARYNAGGTLDTTFSGDGRQTTDFGGGDNGSVGLAIQSNGKIVVAGYMSNGTDLDFAIYRFLSNGNLDTTFSGDGKVNINFGAGRQDYASDLLLQSDGKIVVIGSTGDANYDNNNFAIVRLNPSGSLDPTFSGDGKQITNFGADDYAYAVALQPDNKIVVAGEKDIPNLNSFPLARYNMDGSLDTTFNGTGRKAFSVIAGTHSLAVDVIIQTDGKIVVAGHADAEIGILYDFELALVRLNSGGSFDTTFSGDGKMTVDFGGNEYASALAQQPLDGKYLLGGYMYDD